MKPNFLKDKSSIAVLEKSEKQQIQPNVQKVENKNVQPAQKIEEKPKPVEVKHEVEKPKINLFSAKTFEEAKEKSELNLMTKKVQKIEVEEIVNKEQIEQTEQSNDEEFISFSPKPAKQKKEWKFRLKLLTVIYCAVIAVMTGWVTTNIVRIANLNNAITQTQGEVSANYAKYISQIEKLDDLKENPDNNSNLIPIDEIITVTPLPLEDVTEFEKESNWFDNIINWFGNLFGG